MATNSANINGTTVGGVSGQNQGTVEGGNVITSSSSHSTLVNVGDFNERLLAKLKRNEFAYPGTSGSPVLDDNDSLAGSVERTVERANKHKPFKNWFQNKHNGKTSSSAVGAVEGVSTPGSGFDMQSESGSLHNFLTIYHEPGSEKMIRRGSFSRQTLKSKFNILYPGKLFS